MTAALYPVYYVFSPPFLTGSSGTAALEALLRTSDPAGHVREQVIFINSEWEHSRISYEKRKDSGKRDGDGKRDKAGEPWPLPVFVHLRNEEADSPYGYPEALALLRAGALTDDDGLSGICSDVTLASAGYYEFRKRAADNPAMISSPEGFQELMDLIRGLSAALALEIPELNSARSQDKSPLWNFRSISEAVSAVLRSYRDELLDDIREIISGRDGYHYWQLLISGDGAPLISSLDPGILSDNFCRRYCQDFCERYVKGDLYLRVNSIFTRINSCPRERCPLLLNYWLNRDTQAMIRDFLDRLVFYLRELAKFIGNTGGAGGLILDSVLREINNQIIQAFAVGHGLYCYAFFKYEIVSCPDLQEALDDILAERERPGSAVDRIFPRKTFPDARAVLERAFRDETTLLGPGVSAALGQPENRRLFRIFRAVSDYQSLLELSGTAISRGTFRLRTPDALYEVSSEIPELYGSSFLKIYFSPGECRYYCFMEKRNQLTGQDSSLSAFFKHFRDYYADRSRREWYMSANPQAPLTEAWLAVLEYDSLRFYAQDRSGQRISFLYSGIFPNRDYAALALLGKVFNLTSLKLLNRASREES
ncbi:hypothetical protein [Succinimonas sp.]|uniref:hypothetical protein n=1 Tax=Succinimonas sp. TaxID=1936151 RepID=UPI00386C06B0